MSVREPAPPQAEPVRFVPLFEAQQTIYARAISGKYSRLRWLFVWLTQLVYYGLPWLTWADRPAMLFDLDARRFYVFPWVLYPQDFVYLAGLLILSALLLFVATAIAGRVWCGFACPQTVYTSIFMWVERLTEGDRNKRMRLDAGGVSVEKVARKSAKHLIWGLIALWTGVTLVGYFIPIRQVVTQAVSGALPAWPLFWILFYAFATYGNAGYMREQVCKYMCPYARFQSAMFDRDTLIVSYDARRGEPRGSRKRGDDAKALAVGDCVDCSFCVQVCPTGIDIRKGLQYECLGCGLCVDACNSVMDKMSYPRGLIRYTTQTALDQTLPQRDMLRQMFRPRVLLYSAIVMSLAGVLLSGLIFKSPLKVDVVRDRAVLARIAKGGDIENVYRLQLMNALETPLTVSIKTQGLSGARIVPEITETLSPVESRWVVVPVRAEPGSATPGSHPFEFEIESKERGIVVRERSAFIFPR